MGITNRKGDIAELAVAKDLSEKGHIVCPAWGDDAPYDLIADINGKLLRIQVKYVAAKDGALDTHLHSSTKVEYKNHVDMMAIYCPDTNEVYYLHVKDIATSTNIRLRLEKPKNNQTKGVKMAEDYMRV